LNRPSYSHEYVGASGERPVDPKSLPPPKRGNLPLQDYARLVNNEDTEINEKNRTWYGDFLTEHIDNTPLGKTLIADVTPEMLAAWWAEHKPEKFEQS